MFAWTLLLPWFPLDRNCGGLRYGVDLDSFSRIRAFTIFKPVCFYQVWPNFRHSLFIGSIECVKCLIMVHPIGTASVLPIAFFWLLSFGSRGIMFCWHENYIHYRAGRIMGVVWKPKCMRKIAPNANQQPRKILRNQTKGVCLRIFPRSQKQMLLHIRPRPGTSHHPLLALSTANDLHKLRIGLDILPVLNLTCTYFFFAFSNLFAGR